MFPGWFGVTTGNLLLCFALEMIDVEDSNYVLKLLVELPLLSCLDVVQHDLEHGLCETFFDHFLKPVGDHMLFFLLCLEQSA
jgi:hypothetical protein